MLPSLVTLEQILTVGYGVSSFILCPGIRWDTALCSRLVLRKSSRTRLAAVVRNKVLHLSNSTLTPYALTKLAQFTYRL